jgi:glutamyl-Q tRNA(Asp) synthetase
MEDLDPPREQPGAADSILEDLERLALHWDGPVLYQSARADAYETALASLDRRGLTFECSCSRRDIAAAGTDGIYPGTCRAGPRRPAAPLAIRVRVSNASVTFEDGFQGTIAQALGREVGDFVLKRRDGLIAYQLAVVVDDAAQGITDVVRGTDLLDSTPRQILLQRLLSLPTPRYRHLPVVTSPGGAKLSKQTGARPVGAEAPAAALVRALAYLGQTPPASLAKATAGDVLSWGLENWDPAPLYGRRNAGEEPSKALDAAQ